MSPEQRDKIRELVFDDIRRELTYVSKRIAQLKQEDPRALQCSPELNQLAKQLNILNARIENLSSDYDGSNLPRICKGLILVPKPHMFDGNLVAYGEVVSFDARLGWNIVVDENFSKWYKDEKEIEQDFEVPE